MYAAVHSITFDNVYNAVLGKLKVPHLIIVELNSLNKDYFNHYNYQRIWSMSASSDDIDVESGKDYLFFSVHDTDFYPAGTHWTRIKTQGIFQGYGSYKNEKERAYTSLKIIHSNHIVHCIYIHPGHFTQSSDYISLINGIYRNVQTYFGKTDESQIKTLLHKTNSGHCMISNTFIDNILVYFHSTVGEILGFTKNQAISKKNFLGKDKKVELYLDDGIEQGEESEINERSKRDVDITEYIKLLEEKLATCNKIITGEIEQGDSSEIEDNEEDLNVELNISADVALQRPHIIRHINDLKKKISSCRSFQRFITYDQDISNVNNEIEEESSDVSSSEDEIPAVNITYQISPPPMEPPQSQIFEMEEEEEEREKEREEEAESEEEREEEDPENEEGSNANTNISVPSSALNRVVPSMLELRRQEQNKISREKIIVKIKFGDIIYVKANGINELLKNSTGLEITENENHTFLHPFLSTSLKHDYYYIEKTIKTHYALSEMEADVVKNKPQMIALKASYSEADIYNTKYNNLVAYINNEDLEYGVCHAEIKNPTYYKTTIERLCKSELSLIDISTNTKPFFAQGTPTYVHVILKLDPRMTHKQFNIFLDSSDIESLKLYTDNNNADFTIQLPQRLEFNKNWQVCLKSIFLGNDLYNIYNDRCYFIYTKRHKDDELETTIRVELVSGIYKSIHDITKHIHKLFETNQVPIVCKVKDSQVQFKVLRSQEVVDLRKITITISSYLSGILGLSKNIEEDHEIDFSNRIKAKAVYPPHIHMLVPQNYIVMSDIVQPSAFGANRVNVLKMLSSKYNEKLKIVHFDHYIDQFVPLNIKEFSQIRIRIADSTGINLQNSNMYPTRIQLQFSV